MEFLPLVCEKLVDMHFIVVWTEGDHWKRGKRFPVKLKMKQHDRCSYKTSKIIITWEMQCFVPKFAHGCLVLEADTSSTPRHFFCNK